MVDQRGAHVPLKVARLRGWVLAFTASFYALFAFGFLAGAIWLLLKPWPLALGSLALLALSLGSTLLVWMSIYSVTVVWPTRVEVSNGFRTRFVERSDVKGLRINDRAKRAKLIPVHEARFNSAFARGGSCMPTVLRGSYKPHRGGIST